MNFKWWSAFSFMIMILALFGTMGINLDGSDRFQPKEEILSSGLTSYVIGECVHTSYVSWLDTSVTIDNQGGAHMLYKSLDEKLVYVNKTGQTWSRITSWPSPGNPGYGGNNAIFCDNNGHVHISSSFSDGSNEDLLYITDGAGSWKIEKVYETQSVGLENDIAVDSQGHVYIIHYFFNNNALLLSANASGSWQTSTLDTGSVTWGPASIMIDSGDKVHVMYGKTGGLQYANNSSGSWAVQTLHTNSINGVAAVMDTRNNIYALDRSGLSTRKGSTWSHTNIFTQMLPTVTAYEIYLDEDALALDSRGYLHTCFLTQTQTGSSKKLSIYYASNSSGKWEALLVDQWNKENYNDFPPALAVDNTGNVHLVYVKSSDYTARYVIVKKQENPGYYQSLKQNCSRYSDIYYEDFNQGFQEVDASQNQWSIGGKTWWFPHHSGQAPKTGNSFLILNSEKDKSKGVYKKQEAQSMDSYTLPDEGELIIGLWSDRWKKYPGLPDNNWADSSAGLEFFIGAQHYAVVFVYGHMGVFYDPMGDCKDASAVCQYVKVAGWSTIAAATNPIALRMAWTTTGNYKTFNLYIVTTDSEGAESLATISNVNYLGEEALRFRLNANVTDTGHEPDMDSETLKIDYVCLRSGVMGSEPKISLNRQRYYFGVNMTHPTAGPQPLLINNSGAGTLHWTAASSNSWLTVYPASGTGNGEVSVTVNGAGLIPGAYTGTITVSDPNGANSPQTSTVTLNVYSDSSSAPPFGEFSTPVDGSNVSGSVPVTGWVLDDINVESVKIYHGESDNMIYIGDAVFVEGARPDVELAYPGYPMNSRAGWGYLLLTNFLPGGGNGAFNIHAIATDAEGRRFELGVKTIHVDNQNAVKPFGAIDTPGMGALASGSQYINFGWALTPQPNMIPTNGGAINVYVDGVNRGHPTYNNHRDDIAGLFPGYSNSNGAGGYFYLDTRLYENGVHTIHWTATDNAGNTDGIGSRYFTIYNAGNATANNLTFPSHVPDLPLDESYPISAKKGRGDEASAGMIKMGKNGAYHIGVKELESVIIEFSKENRLIAGYMIVGKKLRPLPIGALIDREEGKFYWQPGPGFIGNYNFVFVERKPNGDSTRRNIVVEILPKY